MKTKFFSFALALVLMLTCAVCLTACGGNAVNIHNKTYVIGTTGEWSYQVMNGDGTTTDLANPEQWIAENWETIVAVDQSLGCENASELFQRMKELCSDGPWQKFLKGAVITIGEERVESKRVHKSDFICKMGETVIYQTEIITDTNKKDRKDAFEEGGSEFGVYTTDYDAKTGTIKDVQVHIVIRFTDEFGDQTILYSNRLSFGILLGDGVGLNVVYTYHLESVENN